MLGNNLCNLEFVFDLFVEIVIFIKIKFQLLSNWREKPVLLKQ